MHLDRPFGNDRARAFLARAVTDDAPSHAYLFSGPAGVGKTTIALAFAADLLEAKSGHPTLGIHPDLWLEDSDAETISIDVIRRTPRVSRRGSADDGDEPAAGVPAQTLQGFLSLKGLYSDRRVAIMARAQRLSETAAPPLLKTIEEPPAGAVVILCTESADLLPETIRSRCQTVEFQALGDDQIKEFLHQKGLELEPEAVRLAQGSPGQALLMAEDSKQRDRRLQWAATIRELPGKDWLTLVAVGAQFAKGDSRQNRALAREAVEEWEGWLRDQVMARTGAPELAGDPPAEWPAIATGRLVELWESAEEARDRIQNNVNPRLVVEVFLSDVARAADVPLS